MSNIRLMPYEHRMTTSTGAWEYVYNYGKDNTHGHPQYYHVDCDCLCDPITGECFRCKKTITGFN